MKPKRLEVYIKKGYHVDTKEGGKTHAFWVKSMDSNINPYEYALYKLSKTDEDNPSGYTVSIPAMMEQSQTPYVKAWKIVCAPPSVKVSILLKAKLLGRTIAWFFILLFMKKRIEKEKLMRLSSIIEKENTLYYKWSPEQFKYNVNLGYIYELRSKETDLDEVFFK
jgi:hypothetical protein